ncbi:MAG: hypothetical protein LBC68_15345 [Prevotellaceae bacterium]|jgi:hypothetical protein|nr:hypothetical protein [Prevotellaceae bacterium]
MKHIFKIFTIAIAAAFMFTSCAEDAIDQLSGKYPLPDDYALSNLLSQDVQKNANTRTITLAVGSSGLSATDNGTGSYLHVEFLVRRIDYFLSGGAYTIASDTVAKAGNYIMGNDNIGSYWAEVAGGAEVKRLKIKDGTVYVSQNGDNYTIRGTIMLEDRSMVKINYSGVIVFEPDPPALTYTLETETPAIGGGVMPAPIANSRMNKITVFADGIQLAYFEVVTADNATSLSGSYVVTDGLSATGQANNGYYMDLSAYGMGIMKGGSYYIDGTEEMFIRAGGGNIDITDNGGTLTITGSNLPIQDISTGMAFGVLPTPGSIDYQDVTLEVTATHLTYTLEITAPAMGGMMGTDPIAGSQLNKISVLSGSDLVAYFELVSAENPAALTGDYVVTDGINATGQAANGFQLPAAWGGMFGGCYYVVNGEKMFIRAGGGNISVTDNGGVLTITGSNLPILDVAAVEASGGTNWANLPDPGSLNYQNVVPAGSGGGNAITLTNVLSASALDNSQFGGTGYTVTLKIGEAGVTAAAGAYGVTIGGTGKYVSIDLKRDAGTLVPGTYNIVDNALAATGDAVAGYDPGYNMGYFGSVWGTTTSDVTSEVPIIAGGTVEVTESGGVYTITVNATTDGGETVNAVYTGAITIQ